MDGKQAKQLERLLEVARQDSEVLAVILFGSAVRSQQTARSDLDVCLVLMPRTKPYESIALSRKRLEYLRQFDLDVQIFQQLPLYIRPRVLKEGKVHFVREEDLLYEVAFRTAQAFEDFKHIYYEYLEQATRVGS